MLSESLSVDVTRGSDDNERGAYKPCLSRSFWCNLLVRHKFDLVRVPVAGVLWVIVHLMFDPFNRVMIERDPLLSYPVVEESVSMTVAFGLCFVLPAVSVLVIQLLLRGCLNVHGPFTDNFLIFQLILCESLAVSGFITNVLKNFVGRPRPNFFALCDYKGYRAVSDAMRHAPSSPATNTLLQAYLTNTTEGAFAELRNCNSPNEINFGRTSFVSGHSSFAFAGLLSFSLFIWGFLTSQKWNRATAAMFASIPTLGAIMIAATRSRDYYHNYDDVGLGAVVGAMSALCYYFFHMGGGKARGRAA